MPCVIRSIDRKTPFSGFAHMTHSAKAAFMKQAGLDFAAWCSVGNEESLVARPSFLGDDTIQDGGAIGPCGLPPACRLQ